MKALWENLWKKETGGGLTRVNEPREAQAQETRLRQL